MLTAESTRALKCNLSLKVGRSHEYKADPACLYIGDLKVPKKYATVRVGGPESEPTPLFILFESICTTHVNGVVYKLPSRDAPPMETAFSERRLLLGVNPNKSDRIKIEIHWVPVNVMVFSKRIEYGGHVQESPLPAELNRLVGSDTDVRVCTDPFKATHYAALTESSDYNLQIAVLRALPVVSKSWCDFLGASLDDVGAWLHSPDRSLCFPNESFRPNPERRTFLNSCNFAVCTESRSRKQTARVQAWLACLHPQTVQLYDMLLTLPDLQKTRDGAQLPFYAICTCADPEKSIALFGKINTTDDLWRAVLGVDVSQLRKAEPTILKQESQPPLALTFSQRRKRRAIERVSDTNFFLLVPSSAPVPSSQDPPPDSLKLVSDTIEKSPSIPLTEETTSFQTAQEKSTQAARSELKRSITPDEQTEPPPKRKQPDLKIVPQISLAEAVLMTKQNAISSVKSELDAPPLQNLGNLITVEEVDFSRNAAAPSVPDPKYKGRKNFKQFKKLGPISMHLTRTFIEMVDENNDVTFTEYSAPAAEDTVSDRIERDFENEIGRVSGFQPKSTELFVGDASLEDESLLNEFLFKRNGRNDKRSMESKKMTEQDDDEFTFKFTRR